MNYSDYKVMFVYVNERMRTVIPLNISYLSAAVKQAGFSACLFDTSFYKEQKLMQEESKKVEAGFFEGVDYGSVGVKLKDGDLVQDLLATIEKERPQLIAFSVFSQSNKFNLELATAVKEKYPSIPTIFGGVHVNIEPEEVLKEKCVDYICLGEGEEALVEFCHKMMNGDSSEKIRNIGMKIDGELKMNPVRKALEMDKIPFPDWDLFEPYHLYGPFRGKLWRMGLVEYSRTCPYNCYYCGNDIMRRVYREGGNSIGHRYKSPRHWVDELKRMKEQYGINFLFVADGTFLAQTEENLEELAEIYEKEVALPFFCCATVFGFTEKKARLLKKMGCVCVNMGIESGSDEYRRKYMNRKMSNSTIVETFRIGREAGMEMRAYNIIGMPFETRKDIFETIKLNREAKVDSLSLAIFIPYQGTALRDSCIKNDLLSPDAEILGDGTTPMIKNPHISDEELIGLYNTFLLYSMAPEELYPEIKKAEANTPEGIRLRGELIKKIK